jgi:uncharacterized membrane protein
MTEHTNTDTDRLDSTDTPEKDGGYALGAVVLLCRIVQVALVLSAVVLVVGSLQLPAITAVFVWVFALVLLAFAGVVQAVIMGVRKRWGSE